MKDILFTHGYFLSEDEKEQKIMRPYPPLGLLYVSAYLEENGLDNEIFDTTFSTKQVLQSKLKSDPPQILAIYCNLMTKLNVVQIVKFIRENASLKGTKIILGGPDITYNQKDYLNTGADFLVIGEGEQTMLELCQEILNGKDNFSNITGISYLLDNEVHNTGAREKIKDLDTLPLPNRKKIDLNKYLKTWKEHHGSSSMTISTQRGCPYTCKWCSTAVYGQSYRRRSPESVVAEIKALKKEYEVDSFWFVDDVFTVSHKWLAAFAEEVEKQNLDIAFECISRADRMNEEVIAMLKKSGCMRIWIGAESGSQKIIDRMDRRVDVDMVRKMIQLSRAHGIEAGTFIMLGYPGETQDDIDETIKHLIVSNPDQFTITVAYPIKGTALFEEIEGIQVNNLDWQKSTDRDRDFKRTYSRKYYDFAVKHVVNEVNFHKQKLQRRHLSSNGIKYLIKSKVARAAMDFHRIF